MAPADILRAVHSPLPWLIDPKNDSEVGCPDDQDPSEPWSIAICTRLAPNDPFGKNNASFIVRACNAHYQMLEALKQALADIEGGGHQSIELINAAIDKAEGR